MMSELEHFVHCVYGTAGSDIGISCENCGITHPEGADVSFTHDDNKRQIAECCFGPLFGGLMEWADAHDAGLLEYLLYRFQQDPLDRRWRSFYLRGAIYSWRKKATEQQADAQRCLEAIPE
ncbi:hypothetical protein KKD19_04475 [Patescibacteria group bacterium]|nr:hypothetical protein [Patescibacteria group bacterium]MBU4512463.1 hypothetical protein [Patescibacteria group bacterium]MCG2692591.1 hypothetical protein [Candidatus Parcubacteria bacterium]